MIPYHKALDLILAAVQVMPVERVCIEAAAGRVLRQTIRADRDFPSFDRVMMDGYALRAADLEISRCFHILGSAPAGKPQAILTAEPGVCLDVMTGAPMPIGADCIVPVEHIIQTGEGGISVSPDFEIKAGLFIHCAGSDAKAGDVLLEPGNLLGSREIGVAASCGACSLEVSRLPRIAIQPTGDELVAIEIIPEAHQIRQSNGHAIRAALERCGYPAMLNTPLTDDASARDLLSALESSDWLILTGAVSKGARDFLPSLLDNLGCTKVFHGVAQRPGKPAGFWIGPQGQAIMALPGNPVSAITGLHAFVLPALAMASGLVVPKPRLVIPADRLHELPGMTHHVPVTLGQDGRVRPATTSNSGDFIGLLRSDGFVTVPPHGARQAAYPFTPWQ